ncbi:MAG: pyridoxal-phosphate dependent enzyme [Solirubrobacterales bacterium]
MSRLHDWSPELRETLPHVPLGSGPTPVRPLPGLENGLADLWLKDDGAFGDGGWGGNKVRKLEWILPDAIRRQRETVLTFGGLGTNWGLATALYGRDLGLKTALALLDQPVDEHVREQLERLQGSGATLHFTHSKVRTALTLPKMLIQHANGFRPPYILPAGGSSPLGALGYVEAAFEIAGQVESGELPEPSHIVVPVGTGGTVAGLMLGLQLTGLSTQVVGVIVNDKLRLDERTMVRLAKRSAWLLGSRGAPNVPAVEAGRLTLVRDWLGEGYGHGTPEGEAATDLAIETEELPLDPVYTAKAMAALLAMDAKGSFGEGPVLFINTNGPR